MKCHDSYVFYVVTAVKTVSALYLFQILPLTQSKHSFCVQGTLSSRVNYILLI